MSDVDLLAPSLTVESALLTDASVAVDELSLVDRSDA
jgi:hypothetical protein